MEQRSLTVKTEAGPITLKRFTLTGGTASPTETLASFHLSPFLR